VLQGDQEGGEAMKGNRLIPLLRRGDGSTLSLDFTAMSGLDSRFTFSRASTATFINSSGLVESAANGVARFDYDPTTLAPRGLLIEGSATNLVTRSEAFTTGVGNWTDSNITRDGTLRTSPDGTANALRITASAGNATIIRTSAIGTSAGRTFSIWLRRVTGTGNIDYTQDNGANWNTQAITSSWVRYTFTHTADHQVGIRIVTSGDAIELWGAQLEAGSGASSYIPTGASTVQRAADSCSFAASASWLNTANGTFVVNWHRGEFGTQDRGVLNTDYVSGRWLGLSHTSASNTVNLSWWNGQISRTTGTAINKSAYTYGQTTGSGATLQLPVRLSLNGSAVATGTFGNGTTNGADVPNPVNWTNFVIGAAASGAPYTAASRDWLNNCVRSIKYWPTVLPDATLQSLTQ